jgi:hypothetical protein
MNSKMRHKRILGGSVKNFLGKANDFLKKTKLLSTVGNVLNNTIVPMPYRGLTQKVVDFGKSAGYGIGRKKIKYTRTKVKPGRIAVINRSMLGQGLRLAGSGTRPNRLPPRLPSYF